MKIAFFTNTYLPISYGSVTSVRNFRLGLEGLGHEVYIFTPRVEGFVDEEKNIVRTPSLMYGKKIKYPLPIPLIKSYLGVAKKIGFDVAALSSTIYYRSVCKNCVSGVKNTVDFYSPLSL